jgi:hypothetical protein
MLKESLKQDILTFGICILIAVLIFVLVSGCSLLQRAKDTIFNKPTQTNVIPDTPKKQLWETIKGLTPNWLAIPVIALGAVAMFNGAMKLGMSFIIFGSVNLFMALATSRFGFWMALCGLIGSFAAVAASIVAKNKALRDIIYNVQTIKKIAKDDNIDLVFQDKTKEILSKQATSTKKIVQNIKSKAKLKGEL